MPVILSQTDQQERGVSRIVDEIEYCSPGLTHDEEATSKIMEQFFEDLKRALSSIGELKNIQEGCIVLTFSIRSAEQLSKLKSGVESGELLERLKQWLGNHSKVGIEQPAFYDLYISHRDIGRAEQFLQPGRIVVLNTLKK